MRKLLIALAVLAAGCSRVPMLPGLTAHKIEIQQGNYITQDMVAKLKPGMTRSQVRYILGTPLVADPFHSDRWDYVYQMQKQGETVEFRRIYLLFEQDKLVRIEGDVVPAAPGSAERRSDKPVSAAPKPEPARPADAPTAQQQSGNAK
ncbi:MAG: outer membrane protein assembly factor BamE [Rhodospirillaceae bacterium]